MIPKRREYRARLGRRIPIVILAFSVQLRSTNCRVDFSKPCVGGCHGASLRRKETNDALESGTDSTIGEQHTDQQ